MLHFHHTSLYLLSIPFDIGDLRSVTHVRVDVIKYHGANTKRDVLIERQQVRTLLRKAAA